MLSYEVRRSTTINRSCQDILNYLMDYKNWPAWSPWLILEPDCTIEYHGQQGQLGASYLWDGDLVGAGNMTLTAKDADSLDMALHFLRPFKSHARVRFEILQANESCVVTWIMSSRLPWYLFCLKNMMRAWIGMDFDRGLLMLKSQLETGAVLSELNVIGERQQPKQHYIGLKGRATIPDIGLTMQQHMTKLSELVSNENITISGPRFTFYESMDINTTESEFFTCLPVSQPTQVDPPFVCDELEACDTFVILHKGAYPFMGNAWSLAMMSSRHEKIKTKKQPMGLEVYLNSPEDTPEAELLTEVVVFKK